MASSSVGDGGTSAFFNMMERFDRSWGYELTLLYDDPVDPL